MERSSLNFSTILKLGKFRGLKKHPEVETIRAYRFVSVSTTKISEARDPRWSGPVSGPRRVCRCRPSWQVLPSRRSLCSSGEGMGGGAASGGEPQRQASRPRAGVLGGWAVAAARRAGSCFPRAAGARAETCRRLGLTGRVAPSHSEGNAAAAWRRPAIRYPPRPKKCRPPCRRKCQGPAIPARAAALGDPAICGPHKQGSHASGEKGARLYAGGTFHVADSDADSDWGDRATPCSACRLATLTATVHPARADAGGRFVDKGGCVWRSPSCALARWLPRSQHPPTAEAARGAAWLHCRHRARMLGPSTGALRRAARRLRQLRRGGGSARHGVAAVPAAASSHGRSGRFCGGRRRGGDLCRLAETARDAGSL